MDYKEEYNAIVQRCRELHESGNALTKQQMEIVCPQLKESYDERIRKDLITFICQFAPEHLKTEYVSYLEKLKEQKSLSTEETELNSIAFLEQMGYTCIPPEKEQKPVKCIDFDNEFENQLSHLIASVLNGEHGYSEGFVKYAVQSLLGYAQNELKSAEWSKEDEYCRNQLIVFCENCMQQDSATIRCANWLKSLRPQPHWKPSKEQMAALKNARYMMGQSGDYYDTTAIIDSLITDLQKL